MSSKTKEPDTVGQAIPFIPPDPALSIIQRLRVKRKIFQDTARRLFLLHLTLLGGGGGDDCLTAHTKILGDKHDNDKNVVYVKQYR